MPKPLLAASLLACFFALPAAAQLSISFGAPVVHIGISLPVYPTLQRIPGYPVYYAPNVNSNYFFYDGLYWVYDEDNWYSSSWYNGPWQSVDPYYVPSYVLRVPVRYYRHAPQYFRSWRADAPPRWGEYFGGSWAQRRSGWDRWDRNSAPAPAPLPAYQRQYAGNRYPPVEQQVTIQTQSYRYQPREPVTQQHFEQRRLQVQQVDRAPLPQPLPQPAPQRQPLPRQQAQQLPAAPIPQPMQQRQGLPQPMAPNPRQAPAPREHPAAAPQEQPAAAPQEQGRGPGNVPGRNDDRGESKGKGHGRGEERGKGRDKD
ncbi:MAG: hypothetical protein ABIR98_04180 [Usitatibacter sp.]